MKPKTPLSDALFKLLKISNSYVTFNTYVNHSDFSELRSRVKEVVSSKLRTALAEVMVAKNIGAIAEHIREPHTDSVKFSMSLHVLTPDHLESLLTQAYELGRGQSNE